MIYFWYWYNINMILSVWYFCCDSVVINLCKLVDINYNLNFLKQFYFLGSSIEYIFSIAYVKIFIQYAPIILKINNFNNIPYHYQELEFFIIVAGVFYSEQLKFFECFRISSYSHTPFFQLNSPSICSRSY